MRKQPLLIMLACFVAGILFCDFLYIPYKQVFVLLVLFLVLFVFSFFKFAFLAKPRNYFLGISFFLLGIFSHSFNSKPYVFEKFEGKQKVIFELNKKLNSNKKYKRYEVKTSVLQGEFSGFQMIINIPKEGKNLDFEHYYSTEIYINKVESPENDFQFNYAKYLARKGIFYQGFANSEILESPKSEISFPEKIKQKRIVVLNNIDDSKLPTNEKAFLKGIILADRTEMSSEMVSDFSKSGLIHFLAISGTHLAIIFWLILYFLQQFFSAKYRRIPILISLILIWCFTIFIDYGSSVLRSCIMITAYYGFVLLQRKPDLLHAMAIAGFLILIIDSQQLFDVGFQLSFIAVFGIFWLNEPILKYLPKPKNTFQNFMVNVVSVSFSAQIVTFPLVVFYFHQYSFLSIVANLIIVPFSELIIIFSLLMTVLFALKIEWFWLDFLYEKIVNFLLKGIHFFASQDWFFIKNIPMNLLEVILLFGAIFLLKNVLLKKNGVLVRFLGILFLFVLVRISSDLYQFRRSETIFVENFNQKMVIQKEGDSAVFWISKEMDLEKAKSFVINPYINSRRVKKAEIKYFSGDFDAVEIEEKFIR